MKLFFAAAAILASTTGSKGSSIAPECENYDPDDPPDNWPFRDPDDPLRWNSDYIANRPADLRCNLTPPLTNINSYEAFRAYQEQTLDGGEGVLLIDVRTPEEAYWVGVPAQVNEIVMSDGSSVIPDKFMAQLDPSNSQGPRLNYEVEGNQVSTLVENVASTDLTGISYLVPVEYRDTMTGGRLLNEKFGLQLDALAHETQAQRVIFFCRSGQRSSVGCYFEFCPFQVLFPKVFTGEIKLYEVETDEINGRGGFESTAASDRFIGYRGFPGRGTDFLDSGDGESVSFKDMGLPIRIGDVPKTIEVGSSNNILDITHLDNLDAEPWALKCSGLHTNECQHTSGCEWIGKNHVCVPSNFR